MNKDTKKEIIKIGLKCTTNVLENEWDEENFEKNYFNNLERSEKIIKEVKEILATNENLRNEAIVYTMSFASMFFPSISPEPIEIISLGVK